MSDDKTAVHVLPVVAAQAVKEHAYLIVITGKAVGRMFKVHGDELVIGRSGDVDVVLDDEGVSRRHAALIRNDEGKVELRDMASTNGTWANGARIESHVLRDGDRIQIGSATILKFSYQDTLEEQFQKQLYDSATRDGLTRIYNKRYFQDRLREEFAFADRHKLPLALVLFDIDHFKRVNDELGHPAGDQVLQALAGKVAEAIRTDDILCRFGGEEFAVIMRETAEDKAFIFAERVRRLVVGHPFTWRQQRIPVTISLGVAVLENRNHANPDDLVGAADRFLYRAKQGGRNRVEARMVSGD
jgi:two-component system cell cycle response regulator